MKGGGEGKREEGHLESPFRTTPVQDRAGGGPAGGGP